MSDSKVKMHHIPFPLGSDPDPTVFRAGLPGTSKRREGKEKEAEGCPFSIGSGGEGKGHGGMSSGWDMQKALLFSTLSTGCSVVLIS